MTIATQTPDPSPRATLFARIPEVLSDAERQRKYDDPLLALLQAQGNECSVRGFALPETDRGGQGVGIEVAADSVDPLIFVAQYLTNLGAPRQTVIEVETSKASFTMSLDEAGH